LIGSCVVYNKEEGMNYLSSFFLFFMPSSEDQEVLSEEQENSKASE
jgi:hypothetical protein